MKKNLRTELETRLVRAYVRCNSDKSEGAIEYLAALVELYIAVYGDKAYMDLIEPLSFKHVMDDFLK